MTASTVSLVGALCHSQRVFLPLLDEHMADNFGEILPHLVMSDIVRAMADQAELQEAWCREVWDWLDAAYLDGDEAERELLVVSGVEMIPDPGERGAEMRAMLGPNLRPFVSWTDPRGK
ncbi:hypothetical protein SAMN05880545_0987 [Microbacterium sp. RU33B]|nr:hypothetical protein SAMN05880545_0987 [Microbacterium sp. RU33B]